MRRSRWIMLLAIVMGFSLVAAACGNDSDSDGDTGGDTAGDTEGDTGGDTEGDTGGDTGGDTEGDTGGDTEGDTGGDDSTAGGDVRGVTDTEVRIGLLGQLQFFPGMKEGALARMQRENDNGGIGGRDLVMVNDGIDDNSDAQANLDGAKQLVEQEEIFALVSTSAVMLPQTTDYLAEEQVPFSGWGFMPGFCEPNKWGFGFNGCLSGFALGVPGAPPSLSTSDPLEPLVGEGFSVVVFNSDDTAGEAGGLLYRTIWGDQILAEDSVPTGGTVTDFTPYVNTVLDNDPDVVIVSTDFATAIPLKAAIIGAGYEGVVVDYVTYVPGLLQDPGTAGALEGGYSNTQFPPQEEGSEAVMQIATDLESIGEQPFVTQGASIGYWAMDTLVQIMQAAEAAGGLSQSTFDQVANVDGVEIDAGLDGGLCPFSSLDAHLLPGTGAGIVKVEGGEYVVEVPFECWSLGEAG